MPAAACATCRLEHGRGSKRTNTRDEVVIRITQVVIFRDQIVAGAGVNGGSCREQPAAVLSGEYIIVPPRRNDLKDVRVYFIIGPTISDGVASDDDVLPTIQVNARLYAVTNVIIHYKDVAWTFGSRRSIITWRAGIVRAARRIGNDGIARRIDEAIVLDQHIICMLSASR